ncbi:A-kinase anchor protein 1, mitochondrial [Ornithorhynchus anatinus]|uniref:A-kinase anchoring protein 1 n=1 Tax=Ornithorhynchus anatinus TaxID=9258 RepID=A0A6I8NFQ2_ORNAN|nr:A-kinase anchor protein 1, mitochondrial [Ornithorhynchus anatinus]XP_028937991.1 A-kinase anchor protein 1, mitochondrial [Ornithorhynchus anatinus]
MAFRFRTILPYALPGVLALIGWWWFFSRKKERVGSHSQPTRVVPEDVRTGMPIEESLSGEEAGYVRAAPVLPEKPRPTGDKSSVEPLTLLRPWHSAPEVPDSSPGFPGAMGTREDDDHQLAVAGSGDEAKSAAAVQKSVLPPLGGAWHHPGTADLIGPESTFSRTPGEGRPVHLETAPVLRGSEEEVAEVKETEGTEVTATEGESAPSQTFGMQQESSGEAPGQAALKEEEEEEEVKEKEEVEESPLHRAGPAPSKECPTGNLLSSLIELSGTELPRREERVSHQRGGGRRPGERPEEEGGPAQGPSRAENPESNEKIEQAALQIISNVISAATEEVLAGAVGGLADGPGRASDGHGAGREEESVAPASQKPALGQSAVGQGRGGCETAAAQDPPLVPTGPREHKTYASCLQHGRLSSPISGDPKDRKSKNSAYRVPPTPSQGESSEEPDIGAEDSGCSACMSEDCPSVSSAAPSSDPVDAPGLGDSSLDPNADPDDKPPAPLRDSTVPFSNGVLKGEPSDLGPESRWTTEAEADQSGGSDVNSMDSVDSGCALGKTESHQGSKAGSEPTKAELTVWEIEVPKHLVGRLIGKQGRYVSFLKQTSGAKIYISTLPYTQDFQICHIEGSQHHVDKALNLIGKKFKELNLTNIYAPPPPSLNLPSLPMTSWLMLPDGVTVEVIVVSQVNAGHMFVQQHTHPTFHALRSLDQQMYLCYSQPGIPTLPTPVEVGVICAAPGVDGAWWRAQIVAYYKESGEVEIRYVDYGGYERVKIEILRQIRSDFVTLPFQGAEVLLDSVVPLQDEDHFSSEADAAVIEMTRGTALLAQVTNYDSATGLPFIQLWSMIGEEVLSINRTLVERGFAQWVDSY